MKIIVIKRSDFFTPSLKEFIIYFLCPLSMLVMYNVRNLTYLILFFKLFISFLMRKESTIVRYHIVTNGHFNCFCRNFPRALMFDCGGVLCCSHLILICESQVEECGVWSDGARGRGRALVTPTPWSHQGPGRHPTVCCRVSAPATAHHFSIALVQLWALSIVHGQVWK